ncbi:MAG: TCP-1/cpn60 chaperonin family protein [Candidatus Nanoarchaeia archaeon]|nr:TCP-1/cpn60 chaperonin family protein [Candidatus Nanoarchaeia archaeon]
MSIKKVKTPTKMFTSNLNVLESLILSTLNEIESIVGSTLGPGGRNVLIESDLPDIPSKITKDGVTVFKSLGSNDPYKHLIIEVIRQCAIQTVHEAGDGTTTSTILAAAFTKNLFNFCKNNPKYSPQKVARDINKIVENVLLPKIREKSTKITNENKNLLEKVATISTNGDIEMAKTVIEAFEMVGYGAASHVTIKELSGPSGYKAELIEGFPITKGYEESIGKFHPAFINDQAHQRCILDNPLFILFDGNITDMVQLKDILEKIGNEYVGGNSEFKNVVVIAHKFSDQVLTELSFNFPNPLTINVVPLITPISPIINSQLNFLMDLSAFIGAKIFDQNHPLVEAVQEDFGTVEKIEIYRFRTTIVATPNESNILVRADQIKEQVKQAESKIEQELLEERLGKLTNGIAQLKIFGSSAGEIKEKMDRAEDAVCSVRAAITHGCVPGGCRLFVDLVTDYINDENPIIREIIVPSMLEPFNKLFDNAGYNEKERDEVFIKLSSNKELVYDVENSKFGNPFEMGILDATLAVEQALKNAISIAMVMGTLGGICCFPRDNVLENQFARDEQNFDRTLNNAERLSNEANERF